MTPGAREEARGGMAPPPAPRTGPAQPLACFIPGSPAPQGSKRHVGNGVMVESSPHLPAWRDSVAYRVRLAMVKTKHPPFPRGTPVHVTVTFRLRRGATVRRPLPCVAPDLDKLLRAVLDGLTISGLVDDDGQVTTVLTAKQYAEGGASTGALLSVRMDGVS